MSIRAYMDIVEGRRNASPSLLYHGSNRRIDEPYRPLTHFGTEAAAQERAVSVATRLDPENPVAWVHPVRVTILNALRIRDGQFLFHTPVKLADMLHYTVRAITSDERAEIFRALAQGGDAAATDAIIRIVAEKGYDGFVYRNRHEDPGSESWVIFYPEQAQPAGEPWSDELA